MITEVPQDTWEQCTTYDLFQCHLFLPLTHLKHINLSTIPSYAIGKLMIQSLPQISICPALLYNNTIAQCFLGNLKNLTLFNIIRNNLYFCKTQHVFFLNVPMKVQKSVKKQCVSLFKGRVGSLNASPCQCRFATHPDSLACCWMFEPLYSR